MDAGLGQLREHPLAVPRSEVDGADQAEQQGRVEAQAPGIERRGARRSNRSRDRIPRPARRPCPRAGRPARWAWTGRSTGSRIVKPLYPSSPLLPLRTTGPRTSSPGWSAAPQVSRTQWTGQIPPSRAKWGVVGGCQSWVYTTSASASSADVTSASMGAGNGSPPATYSEPAGSAKSFWTSTTMSAVRGSRCGMRAILEVP